jgi:multicomponent Na+:H+ antiporter subunit E
MKGGNGLLLNMLLGSAWAAVTGSFTLPNLVIGFLLGFVVLLFLRRVLGIQTYAQKVVQVFNLLGFSLWSLVIANLRVAYDIVTPRHLMRPGVITIPLEAETDTEITILANLISLTPGTLSLDVSEDRKVLYIHAMYIDDVEKARREIKEGFERRVLEVLR